MPINLRDEISDYKKLKEVKKKLDGDLRKKLLLKALYYCGSKIAAGFSFGAVAVVKNEKQAKFVGNSSCKSPWCCPVCTARKMSKYAAKISSALDALRYRGFRAAMLTFTIPHTADFSCEEATEILYNTWKAFTVHGNTILQASKNDIFSNFAAATNHKHRVRVTEYTYGQKGWHPHFHCLFWFPQENFQDIVKWETALNQRWLQLAERYTIKILSRRPEYSKKNSSCIGTPQTNSSVVVDDVQQFKDSSLKLKQRIAIMYEKMDTKGSKGVFISKDSNGNPIEQLSSNYLCGWGGDKEITGNFNEKATREGHMSWQQILDAAISGNDENYWNLYFEYAEATRKYRHTRVNFSVHSGICKIIAEWQNSEGYKEYLKKKNTEFAKAVGTWKTVCFFNESQWFSICSRNLEIEILEAAKSEFAFDEISKILTANGISPPLQCEAWAEMLESALNAA